jgi:hypothetical protein
MAFVMTGNIKFYGFKTLKPSALKWDRHIDNIVDTATIILPAMCRMKANDSSYSLVNTGQQIQIGNRVEFEVGYNGNNKKVFAGFVSKVNYKVPVEFECEGYAWQLRNKYFINLNFGKTTVKAVLQKLIDGTDIVLSDKMPNSIDFEPAQFKNYSALQILEWLKDNYHLTIFFKFNELYVGWRATYTAPTVKHRLNWNVADANSLVFANYTGAVVNIEAHTRLKNGTKHKTLATNPIKAGNVKVVNTVIANNHDKQMAANDLQLRENKKGFSGNITGFLVPYVEAGMTEHLIDKRYKERDGGNYFIAGVSGSFDKSGGRQSIYIDYVLSNKHNE